MRALTTGVIALGLILLTGCAQLPKQKGTWQGIIKERVLYDHDGQTAKGMEFVIESGPTMMDRGYYPGSPRFEPRDELIARRVMVVDRKGFVLHDVKLINRRASVSGLIQMGGYDDPKTMRPLFLYDISKQGWSNDRPRLVVIKTKLSRIREVKSDK